MSNSSMDFSQPRVSVSESSSFNLEVQELAAQPIAIVHPPESFEEEKKGGDTPSALVSG